MAGLASQQALSAATGRLLEQAASWDDESLSTIAADLAGFADVLRREVALRRALTDATAEPDAKRSLVSNLLGDKIDSRAVAVISTAVADRWNRARDLRDGLEDLARTALFLRAERNNTLDAVEEELFRFGRVLDAHPELLLVLDDPTGSSTGRHQLIRQLVGGRVASLTEQLLVDLASVAGGESYLDRVNELVRAAAARRNELVATVTSAIELTAVQREQLQASLARIYSRKIALHVIVDANLQGGLRVRIGDEVIDGSVSAHLSQLRQRLAG